MPVYDFSYDWYARAYSILRYSKNENGYIPLSEILVYAEHFELIGTKEEFIHVIRSLDAAENKFFKAKEEKKEDKPEHNVNIKR